MSENRDDLVEEMPEEIDRQIGERIGPEEEISISVSTDLNLDGTYGTGWVLLTDQRLLSFNPDGGEPEVVEIPLPDIRSVEMRSLYGNNILKVRTDEQGVEVARFSKTLVPKFSDVQRQIRDSIAEKEDEEEGHRGHGHHMEHRAAERCPTCGRVLRRKGGICRACLKKRKAFGRLLSYVVPYWKMSAVALLLLLTATFISLMPPLLMRSLIDDVLIFAAGGSNPETMGGNWIGEFLTRFVPKGSAQLLVLLVGLLLVISVVSNGFRALRNYMMTWIGERITFDLRNQVYRHLHTLSLGYFSQHETGRLIARVSNDTGRLQDFIAEGFQEMIRSIITLIIIVGILFSMHWKLALFILIPTPFMVIVTLYFGEKLHRVYHVLWKRFAGISAILADTIPGVRVVKAFVQEDREVDRFNRKSGQVLDMSMSAAKLRTSFMPIMSFITYMGTVIIWWVGGREVMGGFITLGTFTAFANYMRRFYRPVQTLCRLNHRLQRAATSAERVFEILDADPDIDDPPDAIMLPEMKGRVEFRDVTFGYEEGKPVLRDVDFTVEPGEMIGLAGHSGAGKSTLINLICRFYEVNEGAILVDGHDLRDVTVESLRSQIGVVLQEPFMFSGTVAENLAYGKPGAAMEELIAAAKAANAHDFIMDYPDAYDTEVGERGTRVSGGERQRLAIARAILKDPRILILDEATSSVDTETESQIQEALERLIAGRTTFAIAHRLSTLRHSNRLLILERGKLAEIGTHDELIEQDGIYAKLCRMQTEMSKIRVW